MVIGTIEVEGVWRGCRAIVKCDSHILKLIFYETGF